MKTFPNMRGGRLLEFPPHRRVTLKANNSFIELPHQSLLEAHAALAEILHLSGMGEYTKNVMRAREELRCIAEDKDTDIQTLLLCY